jgi:hypothetical protein
MNCEQCQKMVGLNNEGEWVYYQYSRDQRQETIYICGKCTPPTDWMCRNWLCSHCYSLKDENDAFCIGNDGYRYCQPCLTEVCETTNEVLECECNLCTNINNSMISLK